MVQNSIFESVHNVNWTAQDPIYYGGPNPANLIHTFTILDGEIGCVKKPYKYGDKYESVEEMINAWRKL